MTTHILDGNGETVFTNHEMLVTSEEKRFNEENIRLRASYELTRLVIDEFFKSHPKAAEIQF